MDSTFGKVFLFLTNLAWNSRLTIPMVLTAILMGAGIGLQIDINIQTGHMGHIQGVEEESEDDEWETADSESDTELHLTL